MQDFISSFSVFKDNEKTVKEYKKGRCVDDRLNQSDYVVAVMSGSVGVYTQNGVLLSVLKSGDCYGVSNLLVGSSLKTQLIVLQQCTLVLVLKETFREKLKTSLELSNAYNLYLSQKLDFLLKRISLLTLPSAKERVKAYLNMDELKFDTKDEIASYLGISRAQYFRAVSSLKMEEL